MKISFVMTFFFLIFFVSCSTGKPSPERSISSEKTPFILVLGDSNLVGAFGDKLHTSLMNWNEADVMSIAIGGASAVYYNQTMKNICCGFKVRFSSKGSTLKILSSKGSKDSAVILPDYSGSLLTLMKEKSPSLVVIALGSNAAAEKNYKSLVTKINGYDPELPIYWIGPPAASGIKAESADKKIQSALNQYPKSPYHFFSSQKVATHLHPDPKQASAWVKGFIEDLKAVQR